MADDVNISISDRIDAALAARACWDPLFDGPQRSAAEGAREACYLLIALLKSEQLNLGKLRAAAITILGGAPYLEPHARSLFFLDVDRIEYALHLRRSPICLEARAASDANDNAVWNAFWRSLAPAHAVIPEPPA
jgi:hypothetical protein